jgi:FkbM family methyltransferase
MNIHYGIIDNSIDVTQTCMEKLTNNNVITIPYGDNNRARYFSDPLVGVHKNIIIEHNDTVTEYDEQYQITINLLDNTIITTTETEVYEKTLSLQSKLKLNYGTFDQEFPEQKMVVRYLTGTEKVLEIGGNIGRNTLMIASIIDNNNFVILECDETSANKLTENRDLNGFTFRIENSALSNRLLIQKGWETTPSDTLLEGYNWVNSVTLDELYTKYDVDFDTLVIDCEGAFFYILLDMPEILNNINLIIMENDYSDIENKNYVDEVLTNNNFYIDYSEGGGWGPCSDNFYEVWKKVKL